MLMVKLKQAMRIVVCHPKRQCAQKRAFSHSGLSLVVVSLRFLSKNKSRRAAEGMTASQAYSSPTAPNDSLLHHNNTMSEDPKAGKRGLPKDDRAYDDDEEAADSTKNDGEAAAPAAAASGTIRKKRLRAASTSDENDATTTTTQTTIDIFSEGLVTNAVFSYLDVRELLAVSSTSRWVRARIRHHHVVRAALLHGGHAKTSMERLVPLIRVRQIWTPSPLRLLRLVNGKRCEKCNAGKVNLVSDDYGVFLCWGQCLQAFTKKVAYNNKWNPFLGHARVASADYSSKGYLFTHPYRDTAGDPCGPLITMRHMERVQQGTTTLDELLEEFDRQDAENCAHTGGAADEIVQAFDEAQEAAKRRMTEKAAKKRIASDRARAKKREKIQAMLAKIKEELGDGAPWKDAVLAYTEPFHSPPVVFESRLVRQLLLDYVKAPSKATPKKVTELKERLLELFGVVMGETDGHFYDFSFLSETDPMESALREHYCARFPAHEHLTLLGPQTLQLLSQGELLHVLEIIAPPNHPRSTCLQEGFAEILVPTIAATVEIVGDDDEDDEDTEKRRSKAFRLAERLWKRERGDIGKPFHACYQSCLDTFPVLYQQVVDFLNSPEAQAWIWSDPKTARHRAMKIEEVWRLDDLWIAVLEKRDYEEIWMKFSRFQTCYRF